MSIMYLYIQNKFMFPWEIVGKLSGAQLSRGRLCDIYVVTVDYGYDMICGHKFKNNVIQC